MLLGHLLNFLETVSLRKQQDTRMCVITQIENKPFSHFFGVLTHRRILDKEANWQSAHQTTKTRGQPTFHSEVEGTKTMSLIPATAKSVQPPTRDVLSQKVTGNQPTILVVEDHEDTREMLHLVLEMWGCRVVEACNGLEAVDAALRETPQIILMDSRLPFLDGLEATRRIRENGLRDQVKIVALNGSGSPRYHADALRVGCDDSIEKPFDFDQLRTIIVKNLITSNLTLEAADYCS